MNLMNQNTCSDGYGFGFDYGRNQSTSFGIAAQVSVTAVIKKSGFGLFNSKPLKRLLAQYFYINNSAP
jgi:hypothetical protein